LDLRPRGHVLLAGVPRSGRSDIIAALSRVLDPETSRTPVVTDLWRAPEQAATGLDEGPPVAVAEVEVTLAELDPDTGNGSVRPRPGDHPPRAPGDLAE
jgi:hypothetical protein